MDIESSGLTRQVINNTIETLLSPESQTSIKQYCTPARKLTDVSNRSQIQTSNPIKISVKSENIRSSLEELQRSDRILKELLMNHFDPNTEQRPKMGKKDASAEISFKFVETSKSAGLPKSPIKKICKNSSKTSNLHVKSPDRSSSRDPTYESSHKCPCYINQSRSTVKKPISIPIWNHKPKPKPSTTQNLDRKSAFLRNQMKRFTNLPLREKIKFYETQKQSRRSGNTSKSAPSDRSIIKRIQHTLRSLDRPSISPRQSFRNNNKQVQKNIPKPEGMKRIKSPARFSNQEVMTSYVNESYDSNPSHPTISSIKLQKDVAKIIEETDIKKLTQTLIGSPTISYREVKHTKSAGTCISAPNISEKFVQTRGRCQIIYSNEDLRSNKSLMFVGQKNDPDSVKSLHYIGYTRKSFDESCDPFLEQDENGTTQCNSVTSLQKYSSQHPAQVVESLIKLCYTGSGYSIFQCTKASVGPYAVRNHHTSSKVEIYRQSSQGSQDSGSGPSQKLHGDWRCPTEKNYLDQKYHRKARNEKRVAYEEAFSNPFIDNLDVAETNEFLPISNTLVNGNGEGTEESESTKELREKMLRSIAFFNDLSMNSLKESRGNKRKYI